MKVRKIFITLLTVSIIATLPFIYMLSRPQYTFAADLIITGNDLGIDVNTNESLFKIENMYPGFTDTAEVSVINKGEHDFSYTIGAALNTGDQLLFDGLIIEIKDSQGNIRYKDIMSGLVEDLELGTVAAGQEENYLVTVYFPVECGNEYQGKTASVDFIFNARSHEGDIEPGTGVVFEHPFINKNFALRMNSTVPIKFHLVKSDGTLDNQERDVVLVISGPDANGNQQDYVFSQANGNLKFDTSLEEAHYIALLSSFDYSLMVGGNYTAAVKSGDKVLGTRDFIADEAPGTSRSNSSESS